MNSNCHSKSVLRAALTLGASVSALGMAGTAWAQNAANPPSAAQSADQSAASQAQVTNGEIVVTAQFRSQKLQDTPLAITAVNAAIMEAKSQTNLTQVADAAPNVSLKPQGASFGPSVSASIRGIGQGDFNPAYEPGVGIYIDDVYYPQLTGAVFDLLDLDRVEILRGPQGTLSGRNSEGGSIKMFSKRPTGSNTGFAEVTYGSRNRIGLRASADFKLTDDLFGRVSGVFKHQNGYVDQLDFGCAYPAGGSATFVANDGTTQLRNPAGGIPRVQPTGQCSVGKLGEVGYQAVRGMLRYNPSSAIDLNLSAEYTHDEHTGAGEVLAATNVVNDPNANLNGIPYDNRFICGRFCNFANYSAPAITYNGLFTPPGGQPLLATKNNNRSRYDGYNLSANAHIALTDIFSVDNILAYQNWVTTFGVDDDLSPIPLSGGYNHLTHWNWSEELRINAKVAENITFLVGGYYFKQQTNYFAYEDLRYIGVFPLQFIQPDQTPAQAKAGFANVSWEIIPGLTFDGGVRYTDESKTYRYFRQNPDGTVNPYLDPIGYFYGAGYSGPDTLDKFPGQAFSPPFIPVGNGNRTEIVKALSGSVATYQGTRWDWRGAVNYRFSPEAMIYASFATGFKGGGTNPRPFYASQVISFNPEVLYNYEIGAKTDLLNRRLRLNLTGFYGILRNAQIGVSVCPDGSTPCAALVNGGNAHEKGFEAELTLRPAAGFSIDGSVSYLDFHFTSVVAAANQALLTDPQVGSAKWKWTLGAQYELHAGKLGSITPRVDASFQDKIYTGFSTTVGGVRTLTYIPSYTLVNARLTWQNPDKDLSASLEVTNLTDKYYYVTVFDLRGAGAGLDKAQPGRPREWAITIKKKF